MRSPEQLNGDEGEIVTDAERFELLHDGDLDLLAALDVLEDWDDEEGI